MTGSRHRYQVTVEWTGNTGDGTATYRSYRRDNEVRADGLPAIAGSADPAFRGTAGRWNPEQLLVASLSQCHMLWLLHLAADAGIVVEAYVDTPTGEMEMAADGGGRFVGVVLRPAVIVADGDAVRALGDLHHRAHELCFIARSVAFPVTHEPSTTVRA